MSDVVTRLDRPHAIATAKRFVAELDGCYDQLVVAGSLRRRLAYVGDIEVVAVPKIEQRSVGMFPDHTVAVDLLHEKLEQLLHNGAARKALDVRGAPRWGPTLKYLLFDGVRFDLFSPNVERFGWILVLRTGPAAFSRQLVVDVGRRTKDGRPGLLPARLLPRDGWLTERVSGWRIPTPTEQHVFDAFRLDYREPWERT